MATPIKKTMGGSGILGWLFGEEEKNLGPSGEVFEYQNPDQKIGVYMPGAGLGRALATEAAGTSSSALGGRLPKSKPSIDWTKVSPDESVKKRLDGWVNWGGPHKAGSAPAKPSKMSPEASKRMSGWLNVHEGPLTPEEYFGSKDLFKTRKEQIRALEEEAERMRANQSVDPAVEAFRSGRLGKSYEVQPRLHGGVGRGYRELEIGPPAPGRLSEVSPRINAGKEGAKIFKSITKDAPEQVKASGLSRTQIKAIRDEVRSSHGGEDASDFLGSASDDEVVNWYNRNYSDSGGVRGFLRDMGINK